MKRIFTIVLAVLAIAACQKPKNPVQEGPSKVQVEPLITKATEVNFEAGDKIGLTMTKVNDTESYAANTPLTFDGNVFAGDLLWYTDANSESDIYAYYPYNPAGAPASFTVETDQTAGIGGSDLMAASKKGVLPTFNAVTMVFKHQMTKIVIKIDNQTGENISEVLLKNSIPTANLDLAELAVSADATKAAADIKPWAKTEGSEYNAIIVPQTVALNLTVTLQTTIMSQPLASMELKSGGQYTIDVRILADGMKVTASGEIENWTDEGEIGLGGEGGQEEKPVTFEEHDGYFVYDEVKYKTVELADGNTWMAENLRFVPRGRTVSSDPVADAGIWYPAANSDGAANPTLAATDPALAETLGLLYDAATALGVDAVTAENAATLEGVQGICPPGWHIPTATELIGLVGYCSNSALVNKQAPYYDDSIKGASIAAMKEAGWEWQFAGMRNKTAITGNGSYRVTTKTESDGSITYGAMTYLLGSTWYQNKTNDEGTLTNIQYYYMMSTYNNTNEKLTVAYGNFLSGASVRCVKNKQ